MNSREFVKAKWGFDPQSDSRVIRQLTSDMSEAQTFTKVRNTKYIERLAGRNVLRSYNVSEHSFFVSYLFKTMADKEGIEVTSDDMLLVLLHDFTEVITGDLVNLAKSLNEKTKEAWNTIEHELAEHHTAFRPFTEERIKESLGPQKAALLRDCDLLELWSFIVEDIFEFGNRSPNITSVKEDLEPIIWGSQFQSVKKFLTEYQTALGEDM